MYIKTPSAAAVDRRHIFFYFGTLNYRPCGRSRTPNRRAVHHRCFIFTWEIHFSRWATLIVTPHLGRIAAPSKTHTHTHARTKRVTGAVLISAGNHFPPSAPSGAVYRLVQSVERGTLFKCNQKGSIRSCDLKFPSFTISVAAVG